MSRPIFLSHNPSPAPSPALFPSSSNPNFHKVGVSSDQESSYPIASTFNGPYMGIVLVVLLMTFFLMAAFSVYVRRYAFSLDGGGASGIGTNPSGRARGMDRSAIEGLPIVVFHCAKGDSKEDASAVHEWSRRPDCVVCLTDFQEAESLRLLPKCEHCFHPECIDMWLFSHTTCPLCRRSLLPVAAPPPLPATGSLNAPHVSQSPS